MNTETVNERIQLLESAGELSIKETKVMALAKAYQQLAAENKRLTDVAQGGAFVMQKALMKYEFGVGMTMQAEDFIRDAREKHPATDRIVAGIKADGRVEGINFAASRLAAAFNHGFVDKPMAEVFDVVRMILTAKEDLANNPAEDGLSGEYAEKSLAEWEVALREGADK
ncbi:hypothetical protein [Klebsiella oxytoca]|uniref:hypothetical protein n=1 Tax=Klebsiella oxytoca TaxID=571 RepID=UPI00292CC30D|nr:hypothetical protein [Klebsiella oxytoca]